MRRLARVLLLSFCLAGVVHAQTLYGFFPSPPEMTAQSIIATFKALGEHGDLILLARNVPWKDFAAGPNVDSKDIPDISGIVQLGKQNGLEPVFVIDPLNGLDRKKFFNLPEGWKPAFSNSDIRSAMTNYALRIVRQFHPRFLGLASEINTYADTHPEDFPGFLSLYREIYAKIKAVAPDTVVFVTFQWEEINNLMPGVDGGRPPYATRWEQMEVFEPQLDLWAISTYPFIAYRSSREIPADYYAQLAARTQKPLAIAESGYTAQGVAALRGTPQDQAGFLRAVHDQLGGRLRLWIYTLLSDFNPESYAPLMKQQGLGGELSILGMFAHLGLRESSGTPRPGLAVWDAFRAK